ncbi:Glycosyltransferase involved in cell wall bisynthesis [Friedmanniella luteola]|uniref:Glycosyltransferase involved in cell wall bisynthesis n=1 Tax=Friedmanniella luteola TaxID=546871 RepID=A0A1H1PY41_9ACTN|nr:glycosyltransferase family 4 protein [Friedmanniella luteola]SDS16036.1 Glycosyltransferase involved in cell wall bisynthesis [Friedmanniella luteola]
MPGRGDPVDPSLRVVVAAPLGRGGAGGIDRLMDSIADRQEVLGPGGVVTTFRPTRGQGPIVWAPVVLLRFLVRLVVDRSRGRVDLLHINLASHGSTYRKLVVARVARSLGIPYLIHLHGARFHHFLGGAPSFVRRRVRLMFAGAARVVVLGEVWRCFVAEEMPEVAGRVVVLPNATPTPTLAHVPSRTVRFLFLGRIGERKGVPQLLEALGRLPRESGWRATIAGDGDLSTARARVVELGLQERVELPGWVGPDAVASLLAASDVLVLASYDENLPMSVIEAMAAGLAVVTTPVGATRDLVVDGETGLLVPPGDVGALTAALQRLLDDPALRRRLGAAAQTDHAERLEIGQYVARLEALWREVAEGGQERPRRARRRRAVGHGA